MKKIKKPKWISEKNGKFKVEIYSRKYNKLFNVGTFENIELAKEKRDLYILENISDITQGVMPRGICFAKGRYVATMSFGITSKTIHIGYFNSLEDAYHYRRKFIISLI